MGIHHTVPVLTETVEDGGFPVGEFLGSAVVQKYLPPDIQLIGADFVEWLLFLYGRGIRTGTSDQSFDAHNQFLHAEGFLQVVVGTQLESFHYIVNG